MTSCDCEICLLRSCHSGSRGDVRTNRNRSELYLLSNLSDVEATRKSNEQSARAGGSALRRNEWRANIREQPKECQVRDWAWKLANFNMNDRYKQHYHDNCSNSRISNHYHDCDHHDRHHRHLRSLPNHKKSSLTWRHHYYQLNKIFSTTSSPKIISLLFISLLLLLLSEQANSVENKAESNVKLLANNIWQNDRIKTPTNSRQYIEFHNFSEAKYVDDNNNNGERGTVLPSIALPTDSLRKAHLGDKIRIASNNGKNANKIDKRKKVGAQVEFSPATAAAAASSSSDEAGTSYANEQLLSNDQIKRDQQTSQGRHRIRRSDEISERHAPAPACHECLAIPLVAIVGRKQVNGFIIQSSTVLRNNKNLREQQQQQQQQQTSLLQSRTQTDTKSRQHNQEYLYRSSGIRNEQQHQIANQPTIYEPALESWNSQIEHSGLYAQQPDNSYPPQRYARKYNQPRPHSPLEPQSDKKCTMTAPLTVCDQIESYPTDVIFNKLADAKKLFGKTYFNFDSFFSDESHFSSEPFENIPVPKVKPITFSKHIPTTQTESNYDDEAAYMNANINNHSERSHSEHNTTVNNHSMYANKSTANSTYATKSSKNNDNDSYNGRAVASTSHTGAQFQSRHLDATPLVHPDDQSQIMYPRQQCAHGCGSYMMMPRKKLVTVVAALNGGPGSQEHRPTRDNKGWPLLNDTSPMKLAASLQQRPPSSSQPEDFLYLVERQGFQIMGSAHHPIDGVDKNDRVNGNSSSSSSGSNYLRGSTILSRNKRQPYQTPLKLHQNGASASNNEDEIDGDSNINTGAATTINNNNYSDDRAANANYNGPAEAAPLATVLGSSVKLDTKRIATDLLPAHYDQLKVADSEQQITTNSRVIHKLANAASISQALDDKTVKTDGHLSRAASDAKEPLLLTRHHEAHKFLAKRNASTADTGVSSSPLNAPALSGRADKATQKRAPGAGELVVEHEHGQLLSAHVTSFPSSASPLSLLTSLDVKNENNGNSRNDKSVNNKFTQIAQNSLGGGNKFLLKDNARGRLRRQVPIQGDTNGFSANGRDDQESGFEMTGAQDAASSGEQIQPICRARSIYITPRAALNDKKQWKYVVNAPERDPRVKQIIRVDICEDPFEPCSAQIALPLGFTSQCKQKYAKKKLLSLNSQSGALEVDTFFIPSCCVCQLILDTGSSSSSSLLTSPVDDGELPLRTNNNNDEAQASPGTDSSVPEPTDSNERLTNASGSSSSSSSGTGSG